MSAEDDEISALVEAFARGDIDVEDYEDRVRLALSRPRPGWRWEPRRQGRTGRRRPWSPGQYFARQWRERGLLAPIAILADGWLIYCLLVGLPWAVYWAGQFAIALYR